MSSPDIFKHRFHLFLGSKQSHLYPFAGLGPGSIDSDRKIKRADPDTVSPI
jgi:hypothetical protein